MNKLINPDGQMNVLWFLPTHGHGHSIAGDLRPSAARPQAAHP